MVPKLEGNAPLLAGVLYALIVGAGFCILLRDNDLVAFRLVVACLDLERRVDFVSPEVLLPAVRYPT